MRASAVTKSTAPLHFHLMTSHANAMHNTGGFGLMMATDPTEFEAEITQALDKYYREQRELRTGTMYRDPVAYSFVIYPCTEECRSWESVQTRQSTIMSSPSSGDESPSGQ